MVEDIIDKVKRKYSSNIRLYSFEFRIKLNSGKRVEYSNFRVQILFRPILTRDTVITRTTNTIIILTGNTILHHGFIIP